eukprot:Nk52_evm29s153 gene=Nk52_evmTU29s153
MPLKEKICPELNNVTPEVGENEHSPVTVSVTNLSYSVDVITQNPGPVERVFKGQKKEVTCKEILKNVSATISPGKMTALMGPSGAGKSTLLDVIAGLKNSGTMYGKVAFNGKERNKQMTRLCGYVEQKDVLIPTLTVRELLRFSAQLRLPASLTREEIDDRVMAVLNETGLHSCADSIIGDASIRGISGGQAKRVNIAIELLTNPLILYMDEPTTGLDSSTALDIMKFIRSLCSSGRTVICTIHQPSQDIYNLFDNLLMLVAGEVVYNGPACGAEKYFTELGFEKPRRMCTPEFIVAATDKHGPESLITGPKNLPDGYFAEKFRLSPLCKERTDSHAGHVSVTRSDTHLSSTFGSEENIYVNGVFHSFVVLLKRVVTQRRRDKTFFISRMGRTVLLTFLLSTVFSNQGTDSESVYNIYSVINFVLMFNAFGAFVFLGGFINDRAFFSREKNANAYPILSYFFAAWASEIPITVIQTAVYAITYYSVGLRDGVGHLFIYLLIIFIISDTATGIALTFSSIAKNYGKGTTMLLPVLMLAILFAGFYIRKPLIPDYWIWAYYLSFMAYPYNALAINQFRDTDDYNGAYGSSEQLLSFWGTGENGAVNTVWANIGIMVGMWMFWRILPLFGLSYINHNRR